MDTKGPIGVFDSGFGGLTILREFINVLPDYDFLYLGDNARTPYGNRSFNNVYDLTLKGVNYLFDQGCPLVILACNTASAKALRSIQQNDLEDIAPSNRVLGVVRPTTEAIGKYTNNNQIGILATNGTVSSESYLIEINKFFPEIDVVQEACPMWVSLVENGELGNDGTNFFVKRHISNLLKKNPQIDTVVLACTHFPLLINAIRKYLPKKIKIVEQSTLVSNRLVNYLERHADLDSRISREGQVIFLTTENSEQFNQYATIFYKKQLKSKQIHLEH